MRAHLTRALGLGLTVIFLVLALQRVDLSSVGQELRSVNYVWLLPSAMCTLVGYVLRTVRWRVILSGSARAPVRTLFPVLMMGFATNNLLPGRLGEFWRAYMLGRKRNVSKSTALASVVVERVFDGLTLVVLLLLVSLGIQLPGWSRNVALAAALIFIAATAATAVLIWQPRLVRATVRIFVRPQRIRGLVEPRVDAFIAGLASLRHARVLLIAAGLSATVWLFELGSYLLLSRGVNLDLPRSIEVPALGLALVTINLGIMVPSGPGYVGTQEFFGTSALAVVNANPQTALVLVAVSHLVQYVVVTGLGLLFFAREQLFPKDIRAVALVEEPA
ncbi:MAG: flippase-like domain-containing protein [Chloroflexi bacterium]|nr:flippase-like domain-containing protein [Chloroflexota bacterium]